MYGDVESMPIVLYHINYVVAVVLVKTNDLILRKTIKQLERFLLSAQSIMLLDVYPKVLTSSPNAVLTI